MSFYIEEISEAQLHRIAAMEIGRAAILFTSPFCGTCQLAIKMLHIAGTAGINYSLQQININFAPAFREQWKIKSIPCLVLLRNGKVHEQIYAMNSVDELYKKLQ